MANWAIEKMEKRINSTVAAMFPFALQCFHWIKVQSQVFVLMQFDPGMEYRPDWVEANGKCTSNHTSTGCF